MSLLYDIIYIVPVCIIAVFGAAPYIGMPEKSIIYYLMAAVLVICGFCIKNLKGRYKAVVPGIILALSLGMLLLKDAEERAEFVQENLWALWCLGIVAAAFLLGMIISAEFKIRLAASAVLTAVMIYFMISGTVLEKTLTAPSFFIILLCIIDLIQRYWKKSGYTDAKGHLVSVAPFAILLAAAVFMIPVSEKPYDWHIVKQVAQRIYEGVRYAARFFHGKDEDYGAVIGFNDSGSYFGDVFDKEKELMQISTDRGTGSGVYLSGIILDSFDGREWKKTYEEVNEDRLIDSMETVGSIMLYDRDYNMDYYKRVQLYIEYSDFNTAYFFAPSKLLRLKAENEKEVYTQCGADLKAAKNLGFGTKYLLTYIRTNDQNEGFWSYADEAEPMDREAWDSTLHIYPNEDIEAMTYEDYLAYVDRMYEYYLPETHISPAAEEYMEELFADADSDMEKLKCIEEALRGFEYTLKPGDLPAEIDSEEEFLDRLLFETRKGYCTYYATAFVIMARSMGIPARYVQGFRVPATASQPIRVMSSMSHAWPEVYIKNVGWIPFEPTPYMAFDTQWNFMNRESTTAFEDRSHFDEGKDGEETVIIAQEDEEAIADFDLRRILIPLALMILFLLVFILLDRLVQKSRYEKMSVEEKLKVNCRYCLRLLRILGFKTEQGETLQEFGIRVCTGLYETDDEAEKKDEELFAGTCLGFIERYERLLYSRYKTSQEDLDSVTKDTDGLFRLIKLRKGKLRCILVRLGGMRI